MQRTLPIRAIDNAFVDHIGKLFDRLCADLEIEAGVDPAELRTQRTPSAAARFERSFDFARRTHSAMTAYLDKLKDEEL